MLAIEGVDRHSSHDLLAFVRCDRLTGLRRRGIRPTTRTAAQHPAPDERSLDEVLIELDHQHDAVAVRQRHADFLVRAETPSVLGRHSYELADAKLGRELQAAALVQTSLYSVLLAELQGSLPHRLHLDLGGGRSRVTRPTARSVAYTQLLMGRYLADVTPGSEVVADPAPAPWRTACAFLAGCDAR